MGILLSALILLAASVPAYSAEMNSHLSFTEFLMHEKQTFSDSVDASGLWIIGLGSVGTLWAHQHDLEAREAWKDHKKMSENDSRLGDYWGQGVILIYGAQYFFDQEHAIPGIKGLIAGGTLVQIAKYSMARTRPNKRDQLSFPSGHTQAAFTLATSISESYGYLKALPFWGMAVVTGFSRISDDQHWLSDVVAGATLGVLFGRAAYHHHFPLKPDLQIQKGQITGMALNMNFNW